MMEDKMKFSLRVMKSRTIKILAIVGTIFSTAACIWFNYCTAYVLPADSLLRNFEFTVDVINALVVFVMGFVFTVAQNMKENNFYYLKQLHSELNEIIKWFSVFVDDERKDLYSSITMFRVITARAETMIPSGKHYLLLQKHITISKKYCLVEEKYCTTRKGLLSYCNQQLDEYVSQHHIKKNVSHPQIDNLDSFLSNFTEHIDEYYAINNSERDILHKHIEELFLQKKEDHCAIP